MKGRTARARREERTDQNAGIVFPKLRSVSSRQPKKKQRTETPLRWPPNVSFVWSPGWMDGLSLPRPGLRQSEESVPDGGGKIRQSFVQSAFVFPLPFFNVPPLRCLLDTDLLFGFFLGLEGGRIKSNGNKNKMQVIKCYLLTQRRIKGNRSGQNNVHWETSGSHWRHSDTKRNTTDVVFPQG